MVLQKLAGNGNWITRWSVQLRKVFWCFSVRVCTILDFSITHVIWRVVCVTNVQIVTCTFYVFYKNNNN